MIKDEVELETIKDTIKRRMETPRGEWIEIDENDDLFAKAKARLTERTER